AFKSSKLRRPSRWTGRYVTSKPCLSMFLQVSSTVLCSMAWMIMWLPFSRNISAMPLIIRLSDSVAPLVKMISFGVALISEAICCRAVSTASSPAHPNEWLRLAALPNFSVKYGSMASTTRGLRGILGQLVASAGTMLCSHEQMMRQLLQHLGHQRRGDAIFLGNLIGTTSMLLAMHRQVLDGNQAVVGFLGKLEHLPRDSVRSRY